MSSIGVRYAELNKMAISYKKMVNNGEFSDIVHYNQITDAIYYQVYLFLNDEFILRTLIYSINQKQKDSSIELALLDLLRIRFLKPDIIVLLQTYDPANDKREFTQYLFTIVKRAIISYNKNKITEYDYHEQLIDFLTMAFDDAYEQLPGNSKATHVTLFLLLTSLMTFLFRTSHLPHKKIIFLVCNRFYIKTDMEQSAPDNDNNDKNQSPAQKKAVSKKAAVKKGYSINQEKFLEQNLELQLINLWDRFHLYILQLIQKQNTDLDELKEMITGHSIHNKQEMEHTIARLEQEYHYNLNEYHALLSFAGTLENTMGPEYTSFEYATIRSLFYHKKIGQLLLISFFIKELQLIRQQINSWNSRITLESESEKEIPDPSEKKSEKKTTKKNENQRS